MSKADLNAACSEWADKAMSEHKLKFAHRVVQNYVIAIDVAMLYACFIPYVLP